MNVATNEHRVAEPSSAHGIEDALPGRRVAVPPICPIATDAGVVFLTKLGDNLLLRNHIPCGVGLLEAFEQPLFLLDTKQRSLRIESLDAGLRSDMAAARQRGRARLPGPILAPVQDRERR